MLGVVACLVMAKLGQRASCPLGTHSSTGGTPVVPVFRALRQRAGRPLGQLFATCHPQRCECLAQRAQRARRGKMEVARTLCALRDLRVQFNSPRHLVPFLTRGVSSGGTTMHGTTCGIYCYRLCLSNSANTTERVVKERAVEMFYRNRNVNIAASDSHVKSRRSFAIVDVVLKRQTANGTAAGTGQATRVCLTINDVYYMGTSERCDYFRHVTLLSSSTIGISPSVVPDVA